MIQEVKIESGDVEIIRISDEAGTIYKITCPECRGVVEWAPYKWWDSICDCGFQWTIDIVGKGYKYEDKDN